MPIYSLLKYALARRRMSLEKLAKKAGVTLSNLSRLKNSHSNAIRFSTLDALCRILDCQPGDILTYAPDRVLAKLQAKTKRSTESRRYSRFRILSTSAYAALEEGKLEEARGLAMEYLELAEDFRDDWNYGNAVHHGNIVLGRAALSAGRSGEAKSRLLEAGKTPGSPQLMSFGPNMSLALELLRAGERGHVLRFFDLCARFWKHDDGCLKKWRQAVERGRIPDFKANLVYT